MVGSDGFRVLLPPLFFGGILVTPAFAAAVIIADIVGNAQPVTIDVLAVLFVTSRLLYIICYLADWAMMRSIVWFIGMGLVVSFFFVSM